MFESQDDNPLVVDFDEIADQLLEQGHDISPAQIHGCLSAVLAAGAAAEVEHAPVTVMNALGAEVYGELADRVMNLYQVTAAALMDEEFGFHPLLPDDDTELALRVEALAQWCRGFMAGFALAGVSDDAITGDTQEILQDLSAMTDAELDDEADEEESESNYFELVEYLRFSVMNVHAQQVYEIPAAAGPDDGESVH